MRRIVTRLSPNQIKKILKDKTNYTIMQEKCTLCSSIMMMTLLLMVSLTSYAQGDCSAEAGTISANAQTVCRGDDISFSVSGYTLGDPVDGYVGIVFSTNNAEMDITNGSFMNPQPGDAYTYNHDGSALPANVPLYAYSYIGEGTPPAQIGTCNDISAPSQPFILLQDIAAVSSDYACVGDGTAQLAIAANGGLPLYTDGELYTVSVSNATYSGDAQVDNNQSITIAVADGMTWSVTFTDGNNCSTTIGETFSAATNCPSCAADAGTIAKTGNDVVCFGESFGFNASAYTLGDEAQGYVAIVVSPNNDETNPLTGSFFTATEGDNVSLVNDGSTYPYNTAIYGYSAIGEGTPPNSYDPFCNDLSNASQPVVLLQDILIVTSDYVCTSASTANVAIAASGGMPLYDGGETYTVSAQNATHDGDNQINNGENLILHVNDGVEWTVTLTDSQNCSRSFSDTFVAANDCDACSADAGQITASKQYVCFEDDIALAVSGYTLGEEAEGYIAIGISPDAGGSDPLTLTYYDQHAGDAQTVTNDNFTLPFNTTLYAYSYIGRGVPPSQIDPACNDLSQAVSFTLLQEINTARSNYVCNGSNGEVAVTAVGGMPSVIGGELFGVSVNGATYNGAVQVAANENILLEVQDGVQWSVTFTDSQNCSATHIGTFVAADECGICAADAGDISVSDDIVCPGQNVSFSVGNYVLGDATDGYVGMLISPNDNETDVLTGTFYDGLEGDAYSYTNDGSKYAYNLPLYAYSFIGEGTPPNSVSECRDISAASNAFVLLQPIKYNASGEYSYDCQADDSALVHLQITGGLPAYDSDETFTVSVSGAAYGGDANITHGTTITLMVTDGSSWSVSFTDAANCFVSISDTYDAVADCGASSITLICPDNPAAPSCVLPDPDPTLVTASTACASGGLSVTHLSDVLTDSVTPNYITRTYQVTDNCGNSEQCTQVFVLPNDNLLSLNNLNISGAQCGADGFACMSVSGGSQPYNITFQGEAFGTYNAAEQFCFNNLEADFYTVGITDANGCYYEEAIGIPQADIASFTAGTIATTDGLTTFTICAGDGISDAFNVNVSEATDGFDYGFLITDADGNILSNGLLPGQEFDLEDAGEGVCLIYGVAYFSGFMANQGDNIFSLAGCYQLSNSITVTRLSGADCNAGNCDLTVSSSSNPSGCVGTDGEVCLTISGGVAPYSVVKNFQVLGLFDEGVEDCVGGFSAGSYELLVTDDAGCTSSLEVGVGFTPASINVSETITGASCTGNNGSACLSFTGGTAPYALTEGDAIYPLIAEGEEICIDNLPAGNYVWTVNDAENCAKQLNINIPAPAANECINAECGEMVYTCTPPSTKVSICIGTCNFSGAGSIISANASEDGGLVTVVGDFCIEYIPNDGFTGMDVVTVVACSGGDCFETIANIMVGTCELPPVANNDIQTTEIGATICTDLLVNDYDIDGDDFSITGTSQPNHGQVAIDPITGQICYTPNAGFIGQDVFTYTICDDDGCDEATVTVTVTGDPICENPDNLCTPLNTPIEFCVQFCSLDATAGITTLHSTYECGLEILSNNCVRFTPLPGQIGDEVIEVTGCTTAGVCETIIVNISIGGCTPDTPPIAVDDNTSTQEGEAVSINVTVNDQQTEGDAFAISGFSQPLNGTVSQNGNSLVYTPNAGFTGTDVFTYSICDDDGCDQATVQVLVIGAPDCENPSGLCTGEMETITICVNFCGLDATASITEASGTFDCGINILSDNCIEYTPLPGQTGTDIVSITGCTASGDCETIMVDVFIGECEPCDNPELVCSTGFQDPQIFCVEFCDLDGNVNITSAHTTFECGIDLLADNCISYTPLPGFTGPDVMIITGCNELGECSTLEIPVFVGDCDGTQTPPNAVNDFASVDADDSIVIDVTANDQQTEGDAFVLDGFTQPVNGTVTQSGNSLVYTPNAGFSGTDSFTYTICDDDGCDTATVTVQVAEPCENPELVCSAGFQDPQTVCVQFCDLDGNVSITEAHTTFDCGIDIISEFCLTYTPLPGFEGTDSLVITGCNELGECATVTIPVFVGDCSGNQPPVAVDDEASTGQNSVTINVLGNDYDPDGDNFNITAVTPPVNGGTVVLSSDGLSFVYTPAPGFVGVDSFQYQICDPSGACDDAWVLVTVTDDCDPYMYICAEPLIPSVVCVDFCNIGENDISSLVVAHASFDCGISMLSDNCFQLTPLPGQNGTDTLTVVGCNSMGVCDTAYVVAFIGCTAPVAVDDFVSMTNAQTSIIDVLANDLGICGDDFTVNITNGPSSGMAIVNNDLEVVYTPAPGFVGTVTFTYTVCEVCDLDACPFCQPEYCDEATVTITVTDGGSSAVDAQPDIVYTNFETAINISVLSNDLGSNLTIAEVFQPDHGTVSISTDGMTVLYTPDAGFVGNDYFFYVACNDATPPQCDQTIVAVDVLPPVVENLPPMANNDVISTPENEPITFNVLGNDTDPNGDDLTITSIINGPANGTVVINPDGSLTYTPDAGYNGNDMFSYIVCDPQGLCDTADVGIAVGTATGTNNHPIAVDDQTATTIGEPVIIDVLGNDADPDGDNLTVTIGSQPIVGIATVNPDGTITYTPPSGFEGTDYFTYIICDDGLPSLCDTAYVTIVVTQPTIPVNAEPDVAYTSLGTPITINVLINDEGENLTVTSIITPPANGVAVINLDGTITYTPNPDFLGIDYFEYVICNNAGNCDTTVVAVNVLDPMVPNQPPMANNDVAVTTPGTPISISVLDNDVDPDGDPLSITAIVDQPLPTEGTVTINPDGTGVTFTPTPGFTGCVTFGYVVCDPEGACDTAYVGVSVGVVSCTNNPPVALDDMYNTLPGVTVPINVLSNDTEPDGDNLTVTVITPTTSGTLVVTGEGTFDYIPTPDFTGTDFFVYTLCDDGTPVLCDTAYVTINVNVVSNVLDAQPDVAYTPENEAVVIPVLANDIGEGLTLDAIINQPENGTAVINPDGTITYEPNPDFVGTDYFEYIVCDLTGDCDTTLVSVNVYPEDQPNQPPMAGNDIALTPVDTSVEIPVLDNDVDPEGEPLTITAIIDEPLPTEGTVEISPDGQTVIFTPADGFEGCVTFGYVVCDPQGLCDTAYVGVGVGDVDCLNNPPVALDDDAETEPNTPVIINILGNDLDPDGDNLTVTILENPNHGTLNELPEGTFEYTPEEDYMGPDFFVYTICDDGVPSLCDTAYVSINVVITDTIPLDAEPDIVTTPINTPIDIEVLDNDSGNYLDVTNIVDLPDFGMAVINPDNTVTYTPDADYVGVDHFEYEVCDIFGNCEVTLVTVTVLPTDTLNLPPVAVNDMEMTDLDTPVQVDVLNNDFDPFSGPNGGDMIVITDFDATTPNGGTVVLDPLTGNLVYTPATGFTGIDTFGYTICDNGTPVMCDDAMVAVSVGTGELPNNPPVAVDDEGVTSPNTPVEIDLLSDDSDPDGDNIIITFIGEPAHGGVTLNPDGEGITYTPNPDYVGTDFFPYIICDDGIPVLCDTAYVTVTILDEMFDMVVDVLEDSEDNPICPGDEVYELDLPFEDIESITILTPPTNGMAGFELGNDTCVFYTPLPDYFGPDTLSVIACGTVIDETVCDTIDILINVIPVPDAPIAVDDTITTTPETPVIIDVLANDSDPDGDLVPLPVIIDEPNGGTATVGIDGTITYTPDAGTVKDTLVYVIFDATGLSDTAEVVICIEEGEPLVDAIDDASTTDLNTPVDIPVLDNDIFPADTEPTVTILTAPLHGTAMVNDDGSITYTSENNFIGVDTFEYVLCALIDDEVLCDTAQVIVVVDGEIPCLPVFANFITPNNDGTNDDLLVEGLENFNECYPNAEPELVIFNRWGDMVYEDKDYSNDRPWNGTWQETGQAVPDGTYFYCFRYNNGESVQQMNGFLEVHR